MPNTSVRAAAEGLPAIPDLFEARTILTRIKDLNELMFTASEGLLSINRAKANALTAGCDVISKLLEEVCDIIDAQEGGAA